MAMAFRACCPRQKWEPHVKVVSNAVFTYLLFNPCIYLFLGQLFEFRNDAVTATLAPAPTGENLPGCVPEGPASCDRWTRPSRHRQSALQPSCVNLGADRHCAGFRPRPDWQPDSPLGGASGTSLLF